MKIKHSKLRNTSILFEVLAKTITSDTLSNRDSKAISIIKKYFVNTEIGKEYKLCEAVLKAANSNDVKANVILTTVLESSKRLNRTQLRKEKYNLVKEIKEHYKLDEIFKTKIQNYKTHASLYTLFEAYNSNDPAVITTEQVINSKMNLLEYLTKTPTPITEDEALKEFKNSDKSLRILTYRILLEKFNEKYDYLNSRQKNILKEYINSVDSTPRLRTFFNEEVKYLRDNFKLSIGKIKDKVTKIKLDEVIKFLVEVEKTKTIKSNNLVDLLQFHNLLDEVNKIHG